MRTFSPPLPIDAILPQLTAALASQTSAVLVAPPGAGKTTRVPLVLVDEPWAKDRKILVLEPRRLAARAAAARMAATLGEEVGGTVGLRVRFGSKISKRTRIEVVTEGVFTRLILDDPSLDGIAAVLFDEFHERSLEREVTAGAEQDDPLVVASGLVGDRRLAGSRARPGPRCTTGLAGGFEAAGDVRDARRRPGCKIARRCTGRRK